MSTTPVVSNASQAPQIAPGPDNPQTKPPEEQQWQQKVPEKYRGLILDTIKTYRGQWAPDRLMRIPQWMKNVLMYRGQQVLGWDAGSNTYFDALAWWRSGEGGANEEGDTYLEKYINNITQMLGDSFIGTMSRGIPPTIVQPENAEILADVTTAKAAQQAISIIERMNEVHKLVRTQNSLLYLYGTYFKYTRAVLDGEWAGWDEEPQFGQIQVSKPDRYHCFGCGQDTPSEQFQGQGKSCPGCQKPMGEESHYESSSSVEWAQVGVKKTPKAMVKWDVYGPMEVDVDPQAKKLEFTPLLALDLDVDIGALRTTFPSVAEQIKEGQQVDTTPNAPYEKLRRSEINAQINNFSADSQNYTTTYSRNWLQPVAYWRVGNREFAEWMQKNFPMGCKVSLVGTEIVDIKEASLTKEWTNCVLRENVGMYPPSIAENVVAFNERLNDTMNIIDDWVERCAAGMIVYDKTKIDEREIDGRVMSPGELFGMKTMAAGVATAIRDSIVQLEFKLEPNVFTYPAMLIDMAEKISGVTPQTFGAGTQPGVETAKGQAQQLDTSLTKLNIYWENEKDEHARASQNAIECLQKLMEAGAVGELWDVIQANGSEFRNNYINFNKMNGRIKVWPDTDEGLPQSPQQVRETITKIVEEAGNGNPVALKILDVIPNQEAYLTVLAPPGTVIPGAAQRSKTEQDISTLLENDWITDPETGQQKLPVEPEWYEDFPIARATLRLYCQENPDYRKTNPGGWQRLAQYNQLCEQMDMQQASGEAARSLQVKEAGAPPPKKPPASEQQAQALLVQDGAEMVNRLVEIAEMDPTKTGGTITGQTTAAGKVLDGALKAVTASKKAS